MAGVFSSGVNSRRAPVIDFRDPIEVSESPLRDRDRGEVPHYLEQLEKQIHRVQREAAGLFDRLTPVTAPNEVAKEPPMKAPAAKSALGGQLSLFVAELDALGNALERFSRGLQL